MILAYLKFLLKSTNQHGVHSPFVYDLVTKCFYDRKKYPEYKTIAEYRRKLLQNKEILEVTDFGAGSRIFKSSERKISAIARTAGMSPKRARLLQRLVRYLKVNKALELGTSLGIGTAAMATGNQVAITSIEGCRNTSRIAQQQFKEFGFGNITSVTGDFKSVLLDLHQSKFSKLSENTSLDLIFFDGNHEKEATLDYFRNLLPFVHNDSVFIFDDIHWSKDMEAAWEEIKAHPSVSVSIDTFQWGLVFFRREQEKEHFRIRI